MTDIEGLIVAVQAKAAAGGDAGVIAMLALDVLSSRGLLTPADLEAATPEELAGVQQALKTALEDAPEEPAEA